MEGSTRSRPDKSIKLKWLWNIIHLIIFSFKILTCCILFVLMSVRSHSSRVLEVRVRAWLRVTCSALFWGVCTGGCCFYTHHTYTHTHTHSHKDTPRIAISISVSRPPGTRHMVGTSLKRPRGSRDKCSINVSLSLSLSLSISGCLLTFFCYQHFALVYLSVFCCLRWNFKISKILKVSILKWTNLIFHKIPIL